MTKLRSRRCSPREPAFVGLLASRRRAAAVKEPWRASRHRAGASRGAARARRPGHRRAHARRRRDLDRRADRRRGAAPAGPRNRRPAGGGVRPGVRDGGRDRDGAAPRRARGPHPLLLRRGLPRVVRRPSTNWCERRRHPRTIRRARLRRERRLRDGARAHAGAREAVADRRAGGRRQDGEREGARRSARHAPDPLAVLRGARRRKRALRMELSQAVAAHPAHRARRGVAPGARSRDLQRAVSAEAPAARSDHARARAGAADRRDRPRRRSVRSVPARAARRVPGDHPRARHDPRARASRRGDDVEPHARAVRRPAPALSVSVARLSRARDGAGDPARPAAGDRRAARGADRAFHGVLARRCRSRKCPALPRAWTGRWR